MDKVNNPNSKPYAVKYKGVLAEMWVMGFSEPMDIDGAGEMQRSVKASSQFTNAQLFSESEIADALALTLKCFPSATQVNVLETGKGQV